MASELPTEFDKPWVLSDVVLHTNNSGGKDIHAYKGALAMFSPYFRALFFGNFKEKDDASVNVDCDYDAMVEILKNIHQIGYRYNVVQKPYSSEMLVKMYQAADRYDFAFIRTMCLDHIEGYPSVDTFIAAGDLKLYDLRVKILKKMNKKELNKLLSCSHFNGHVSKEELLLLFEKSVGKPLPKSTDRSDEKPKEPLNLEEITEDLENPRVDLTKPWPTADLRIITDNAIGRSLYANKAVVEMMCPNFQKYLCSVDNFEVSEGPVKFFAVVHEEYTAVKEILSIIHNCNMEYKKERTLHPALLHCMYVATDKNHLDIPLIRNFCVAKLSGIRSIDALDALWILDLRFVRVTAMDSLSGPQLRDWIYREDEHLSYRKGAYVSSVTPSKKDHVFYLGSRCTGLCVALRLINNFQKEFSETK